MAKVPKKYLEHLAQVPLFAECDERELEIVASLGTEVSVPKGKVLTKQGEQAHEAFLALEGRAKCFVDDREVAEFGPGDFFGEMALIAQHPRTATVIAETDMRLLVFHVSEFNRLMQDTPTIAVKILTATAKRLLNAEDAPTH
jgi:CRP-like cAMP-binding protein